MGLNNDPVSFSCMRLEDFLSLSHKLTTTGKWGVERTAPPQAAKHMTSGKGLGTHEKADPKPAVTKTKNLFFFFNQRNSSNSPGIDGTRYPRK